MFRFLFLVLTFVLVAFGAAPAAMAADGPPKAQYVEPEFDFGKIHEGTKVSHSFLVKNVGTGPLVIQRIVPACGCTAASTSTDPIPPGQETSIRVEFDSSGFAGEKSKLIRVYSNDADNPVQTLAIKGTIESDVIVIPPNLSFSKVLRGKESPPQRIEVRLREGSGKKLGKVVTFSKFIKVKELESHSARRVLEVSIDSTAPVGELRDRIMVSISGKTESSAGIPVFAQVEGLVVLRPTQISFGIVEGKTLLERSVKLENNGSVPLEIIEVTSDSPAVKASVTEVEAGKRFNVKVEVDPTLVTRDLRASVEIKTSGEEGSHFLSVYGVVPPRKL